MNIYCELLLDRVRLKIDGDELAFQVTAGYYANRMLVVSGISSRIRGYVRYHESDMNVFQRIKHRITKNKVFILVNQEVQQYVTLRQIHEFAARFLGGGSMYIIPKPTTFDSTELESIDTIRTEYIKGSQNRDTVMSQLTNMTQRPAFK
ncbi:MAG TPA: hypothetical protein VK658_17835 [Chryseolinea sp.]|nr:hypothetical protein [Chryseolinea sp.]